MGRIVIVAYKPFPGKEEELDQLMKEHVNILRKEGLATDRESILMKSEDGTVIEVFEWVSKDAIDMAHTNTNVLKMWDDYSKVCEYIPISDIKESSELFSEFSVF